MQVREFDLRSLDKMLPCPFCGGEAELDTHQAYAQIANGKIGHRVVVYCRDCGADQGTCVEDVPDIHPNEVIEQWNKRAALPERELLAEALEARLAALEEAAVIAETWFDHHRPQQPKKSRFDIYDIEHWAKSATRLVAEDIRARAAADKIRDALEHQQKGEKL